MLRDPGLEASHPAVRVPPPGGPVGERPDGAPGRTPISCRDGVTPRDSRATAARKSGGCAPGCRSEVGSAPALPPATLPRQPAREYDGPARRRRNRGRGPPGLPECSEQVHRGAPHRIHKQCGAQAGLGGRRHGYGLACAIAVTFGPKSGHERPLVVEQDAPELPLVEVTVTRRGVRQQHEMTARCGQRPGRYYKQEIGPIQQARGPGTRAVRRRARQGAAPAVFQAQESRSRTSGVPVCGRRACPCVRRTGTPLQRPGAFPNGAGQQVPGLPRQWRRYASSSVRCRATCRCPSPPASQGSGVIRPAWPEVANCCQSRRAGT